MEKREEGDDNGDFSICLSCFFLYAVMFCKDYCITSQEIGLEATIFIEEIVGSTNCLAQFIPIMLSIIKEMFKYSGGRRILSQSKGWVKSQQNMKWNVQPLWDCGFCLLEFWNLTYIFLHLSSGWLSYSGHHVWPWQECSYCLTLHQIKWGSSGWVGQCLQHYCYCW